MTLENRHAAILVEAFYKDLELWFPYHRLQKADAAITVLDAGHDTCERKHDYPVTVDGTVDEASTDEFDAVVIHGGYAPDRMRRHKPMIDFVRDMYEDDKICAAICHAGWMLDSAGAVEGRTCPSSHAIRDDMENVGADWIDQEVVRDGLLITSRISDDLPAFCQTILGASQES